MARTDTLVQTLLPADLASWPRAALDRLQVSGWIRQLIVRERQRLVVEAWWCAPRAARRRRPADGALFRLERLGAAAGDTVEYRLLDTEHKAIDDSDLAERHQAIWNALHDGAFALRGDSRRWRVVHAAADADAGNGMRLVIRADSVAKRDRRTS